MILYVIRELASATCGPLTSSPLPCILNTTQCTVYSAYLVVLMMLLTVEDCLTVPALLGLERITEETLHTGERERAEICLGNYYGSAGERNTYLDLGQTADTDGLSVRKLISFFMTIGGKKSRLLL